MIFQYTALFKKYTELNDTKLSQLVNQGSNKDD